MDNLLARAYRAYFTAEGERADQPREVISGQEECKAKNYVVLRNSIGTLAVYRVCSNARLRRLRRWPAMLDWHERAAA
jgi:hypothetical protein